MLHINLFFLQNKEVFIEFDSSHQSYQLGKLNDPLTSLSCLMVLELTENIDPLSLLNQLPSSLWEKSTANIGKIHSELSVKIYINFLKHLHRINQYPISNKTLRCIRLIDYKSQGFIISCIDISSCNTPVYQGDNLRARVEVCSESLSNKQPYYSSQPTFLALLCFEHPFLLEVNSSL